MRGLRLLFTAAFGLLSVSLSGQTLLQYDFLGAPGDQVSTAPSNVAANLTVSNISRGAGIAANAGGSSINSNGWAGGAALNIANNDYYTFTITPNPGYTVSLTEFTFSQYRSNTGPVNYAVRTSVDAFAADVVTGATKNGAPAVTIAVNLSGASYQNLSAAIEIRVYGFNSGVGTFRITNTGTGNVTPGVTVTGSVALAGGGGCTLAPSDSANAPVFSGVGTNALTLNWSLAGAGVGSSRILVARAGAPVAGTPSDSTTYAANGAFGTAGTEFTAPGEFVVFNNTGTGATVTGLTPGTVYYFALFEYNCAAGSELYYAAPLAAQDTTLPSNVVLSEGCEGSTSLDLSWTFGAGAYDGVVVFAREGAIPSGPGLDDADDYTGVNASYSLAADLGAKGRVVYRGNGTGVTVSGLTTGSSYTFAAYTYVNAASSVWSSGTTTSETIGIPNVSSLVSLPANAAVGLTWATPAAGCFDEVLIIASALNTVPPPSTGTTASAVYGSGTAVGAGYVVYSGTGSSVNVTGLTNGTLYYFNVYVRRGAEWSSVQQISATPQDVTVLLPGDLAIVAINTDIGGGDDEVCFVAFKEILPGTSIDFTDNGYERVSAGLWGDTEGTIRMTRTGAAIPAGTVICIQGFGNEDADFDEFTCGVSDDAGWSITSLNGALFDFNLNTTDQILIMQNGTWTNPAGAHDASYSGNVLYGWTAIGWEAAPGYASTSGSTLYPGLDCFNTNVLGKTNPSRVKYAGLLTGANQRTWIDRINTAADWQDYVSNAAYTAGAPNYAGSCVTLSILAGGFSAGIWTGNANINWFDCSNWENLRVPDETVNVTLPAGTAFSATIDPAAAFSDRFGDLAECNDLTIANTASLSMAPAGSLLEVRGDWTNSNATDLFIEGSGTVRFQGAATQSISNASGTERFASLAVNTGGSLVLNARTQVVNGISLLDGIVQTAAGSELVLLDNTTVSGASDASHVFGPVRKAGDEAFTFPVGSGTALRPISIGAGPVGDEFEAEYVQGDPYVEVGSLLVADLAFISTLEYWNLNRTAGTGARAVTATWNSGSLVTTPSTVVVARYNGTAWEQAGGDGDDGGFTGTAAAGSVTSIPVSVFSPFTLGSPDATNIFPVELLDFSAVPNGAAVQLDWNTAREENFDRFIIERSADENLFLPIGEVKGMGGAGKTSYRFTDDAPLSGISYYRLRMLDLDGSFRRSDVRTVNFGPAAALALLRVTPNPGQGQYTLNLSLPQAGKLELQVFSAEGRLVLRSVRDAAAGVAELPLDLTQLPAGVYQLRAGMLGAYATQRVVKN